MAETKDGVGKVLGRLVYLDGTRLVFLGQSEEAPGVRFIGFRNKDGQDLHFALSAEAFAALAELIKNPLFGMPPMEFPYRHTWRLVEPEHDQT